MSDLSWSFSGIWNESLEAGREERPLAPRWHIWAGEVGGSYIDRYLKMTAVEPTNPPNARSKRKFEAGNMMEWIVEMVLKRAGILKSSQDWVAHQYPDLLKVTGKLDFLAGGDVDWEKARAEVYALELPEFFNRATTKIINQLAEKYPNGMKEIVLEVKSLSAMMFDMRERNGTPQEHHANQLFHYLKAKNMPEGHVVYICKDDLRILQLGILNPGKQEDIYKNDIEQMTYFIRNKIMPDKQQEVLFDTENCRFTKNWKIEYSSYLTYLYGYKEPMEYAQRWEGKVRQFNSLLSRMAQDKKMTDKNKEWEEEARAYFPNLDDFVLLAKEKHISENEEGGEE